MFFELLIKSSHNPQKKPKQPTQGRDPKVENHCTMRSRAPLTT